MTNAFVATHVVGRGSARGGGRHPLAEFDRL